MAVNTENGAAKKAKEAWIPDNLWSYQTNLITNFRLYPNRIYPWVFGPFLLREYAAAAAAKSLQSCPTLCDVIDSSPPGSAIPGIFQARPQEWVAISFSNV